MKSYVLPCTIEEYKSYCSMFDEVTIEKYGYIVHDNHKLAEIKDRSELILGEHKIQGYDADELQLKIPKLYCVREKNGSSPYNGSFVCGLDLMENGKVWEGSTRTEFDTIEEAMKSIIESQNNKYREGLTLDDICIVIEDKMRIN